MKLKERIFKKDGGDLTTCNVYYDEEITKGLYLVMDDQHLKKNLKNLEIEYQVPVTTDQMGIKFSKQYEFVVLTIVLYDLNDAMYVVQFIMKSSCTPELIYNCRHSIMEGLREIFIDGLQMLYATNMEDVAEWIEDQGKINN